MTMISEEEKNKTTAIYHLHYYRHNWTVDAHYTVLLISAPFERSVGSVWFVRVIANKPCLWHAQTIRFRRNVRTELKSTVLTYDVRAHVHYTVLEFECHMNITRLWSCFT